MRIGLYISAGATTPIDAILARFERAEADGFHTAWAGQVLEHDALTLLALAARATRRIELGSWVVPAPLRHPAVLAQQALSVQAASARPARARRGREPRGGGDAALRRALSSGRRDT